MERILTICFTICSCLMTFAQATDLVIDCQTPGWLSSKINYGDQQTVKNLKVIGYINATDLRFIGSLTQMSLNGTIDLADATIVGGEWNGAFKSLPNSWSTDYDYHLQKLILPKTLTHYIEHEGTRNTEIDTLVFDTKITKLEGYDSAHRNHRTDTERTLKRVIGHLIIGENVDTIISVGNANTVQFPKSLKYLENYSCNGRTDFSGWNIREFPNLEYLGFCAFTYDSPGNGQSGFSNNQSLPDSIYFPNIRYYCMSSFDYKEGMHVFFGDKLEDIFDSDGVSWTYPFHSTIEKVSFHFKTMTPPFAGMAYCSSSCTIYVPKGAKQAYIDSGRFSKFTIVEEKQPLLDITIDKHEVIMEVGETMQLFASPIPYNADDPTILWSSDNDSVVSVTQNGILTAKTSGYANIIAMSVDETIRDTCRVTINAHAESIYLSSSSIIMTGIGETYQLEASIIPNNAVNKSVTWKSLNESVCHVSEKGLVIAVDFGTAVVTATTVDGGHTAVCTVKVVHDVENVELETHELTIKAKDTTQLKVKVLPDNAYDKTVTWSSSNDSLATVDADGNVKALAVGEVFIKATSSVNADAADSCLVNIIKRIEVTDSTIVWNDTTFVYSGLSPQPTWKNNKEEYKVEATMPKLEKNVGRWETTVPFTFTDGVDTLVVSYPLYYTIMPAGLTIKANDAERYYRDENPEFTFTYDGFVNDETEDVLIQKPVATTTATVSSPVGTYPIIAEKAEADNYTIEFVEGTLTIKERIVLKDSAIVWNDSVFVYTGLSPQPTWKNTQSEYTVTAEMPELEKNVGCWEAIVPFSFTDNVDTLTIDVPLHYTIKPAPLTVKAQNAERYEGEENPEFGIIYEGFVNEETDSVLTKKAMAYTEATIDSPVGEYPIRVEGAEAQNYEMNYIEGTLNVIGRPFEKDDSTLIASITWLQTEFDYTGIMPQLSWECSLEGFDVTTDSIQLNKNVGTWEDNVRFTFSHGDKEAAVDVPYKYTIHPVSLTIIVNDTVRYEGEENPEFTFTYEGFVNDETEEVLTQKPIATTTATAESPIGTYPITAEGAEADNYTIEYVDGTLTIKEKTGEGDDDVTDIVTASGVTMKAGDNTTLTVSLTTKDTDYNGYQFNLYLPEGISVATDENGNYLVTEKTGREKVALGVSDGSVLFYTTADKNHDALVSGPLMEIELTADSFLDAGNYTIRIERVVCATRENKSVSLPSSTVTVTVEKEAEPEVPAIVTAEDVEGQPAGQIKLPVFLNNATDINAFYFDLTLPKGITVAEDENRNILASLVGDYSDGKMLLTVQPWDASMGTTNNVNTWRFIATPMDESVFLANAGHVLNITLHVDEDMASGVYTARMNVVNLIEANNNAAGSRADNGQRLQVLQAPATASWTSYSSITIKTAKQGDVNGDFVVDVADIASVISVMADGTNDATADVNKDGTVDVADIATIIDEMAAQAQAAREEATK